MNDEFYKKAFNEAARKKIGAEDMKNGAETTADDYNPYACGDTHDKVQLLGYKELLNANHGFSTNAKTCDSARKIPYTQYAAKSVSTSGEKCSWWTRSPSAGSGKKALCVLQDGALESSFFYNLDGSKGEACAVTDKLGVVPVIWVEKE